MSLLEYWEWQPPFPVRTGEWFSLKCEDYVYTKVSSLHSNFVLLSISFSLGFLVITIKSRTQRAKRNHIGNTGNQITGKRQIVNEMRVDRVNPCSFLNGVVRVDG